MTNDLIIGLVVTAVPGFVVGYLMLNKKPPIFRMYVAMLLIGLGYLTATGAIEDIGTKFARHIPATPTPAAAPVAAPKTEPAAAPAAKTETAPAGEAPKPAQ